MIQICFVLLSNQSDASNSELLSIIHYDILQGVCLLMLNATFFSHGFVKLTQPKKFILAISIQTIENVSNL